MHTFVVVVHVVTACVLVLTVLLQAGKGAGMGAAFGGSSASVFGSRGPASLISKITCGAAVIFMMTSLNLSLFQRGTRGSVMDNWSASTPAVSEASPAVPEASPAAPEASPAAPEASPAAE